MKKESIIDGKGFKYLGEFMKDLPDNVMINKVLTGCGMTSLALSNEVQYVIAVPFISLIQNKEFYCNENRIDMCSVYGSGAGKEEVLAFAGKKIMTTYDSLHKVVEALQERGDIKKWKILVDESHKLIDSGAFRNQAVQKVLDNYKKFGSFVFGTATPIKDNYQLPVLRIIPKARIDWGQLKKVKVNFCHYPSKLNQVLAVLGIQFLEGQRDGNAHIFINSVQSITSVIRYMRKGGYNVSDSVRIVCASNKRNFHSINSRLGQKYTIESVNSKVKKINFYTATAFEGCDIFDQDGRVFIATDGSKDYTKIDIITILPQIIGRIRNSRHNGSVELLYTKNNYFGNISELEFESRVKNELKQAQITIEEYNKVGDNTKKMIRDGAATNSYLIVEDNCLRVNVLNWYNEMHNYNTLRQTYYVSPDGNDSGIEDGEMNFNGVNYNYKKNNSIEIKGLNKISIGSTPSFEDLCKDYIEIRNRGGSFALHAIKEKEPLIPKAYDILGEKGIKALKYRKKNIKKELMLRSSSSSMDQKIVSLIELKVGQWYSRLELKEKLENSYIQVGYDKNATASDLKKWYEIKSKMKRINGKGVNGFEIVFAKIKIPV